MAMDTYYVEYYRHDNSKVGVRISAYSGCDAQRYAEQLPDYYMLATYPTKVESGY